MRALQAVGDLRPLQVPGVRGTAGSPPAFGSRETASDTRFQATSYGLVPAPDATL